MRAENLIRVSCIISPPSISHLSHICREQYAHNGSIVKGFMYRERIESPPDQTCFFARRDPRKSRRNSQPHNDTIRHSEQAIKELLMFSEPKLLLEKK